MRSRRLIGVLGSLLLALVILVPGVVAAPAMTITPTSGSLETEFVAVLSGFVPAEKIALRLSTSEATPRTLTVPAITIDHTGSYTLSIPALGLMAGEYTLAALRGAEVVVSARFTIVAAAPATPTVPTVTPTRSAPTPTQTPTASPTAPPPLPTPPATGTSGQLPGLPNTGDGAGTSMAGFRGSLLVALGASLMALALVQRRRKRALSSTTVHDHEHESATGK